jgi:tRNA(fMet)-specific endonuclease VapC
VDIRKARSSVRYLLDTNICIFAIKNKPPKVLEQIRKRWDKGIAISSLTIAELEFGVWNSTAPERNRIALIEFLSIFDTLPFNDLDASAYGPIRAKLKKDGKIIGPIDMLLAAQVVAHRLVLVTNNVKEFERIPDLLIEDWTK